MTHKLIDLPFKPDALNGISEQVVNWHHGKHTAGYINGRNAAEEKLASARKNNDFSGIRSIKEAESFNQAGQVLHNVYWNNLGGKGGKPSGELLQAIENDFGSWETFEAEFRATATSSGRSGWTILVQDLSDNKLHIALTDEHHKFAWWGVIPLLACDQWEHAYYYDQGPNRGAYIDAFFNNINWDDVTRRYNAATKAGKTLDGLF